LGELGEVKKKVTSCFFFYLSYETECLDLYKIGEAKADKNPHKQALNLEALKAVTLGK